MLKKIVIASFVFSMCSCSKVKNESVRVIQTDSFSNALVIKVNKTGKYCIYMPQFGITECLIQHKCSVHTPPSHAIRSG